MVPTLTYLNGQYVHASLEYIFWSAGQQTQCHGGTTKVKVLELHKPQTLHQWTPWVVPMSMVSILTYLNGQCVHASLEYNFGSAGQQGWDHFWATVRPLGTLYSCGSVLYGVGC